jgi:hypothetical protein
MIEFPASIREAARLYMAKGLVPIPNMFRTKRPGNPRWDGTGWRKVRITDGNFDNYFPPRSGAEPGRHEW